MTFRSPVWWSARRGQRFAIPALLTNTSQLPKLIDRVFDKALTYASSDTSPGEQVTLLHQACDGFVQLCSRRPLTTTYAPSCRKRRAVAAPYQIRPPSR